jgi:hypothetical protein
MVHLPSDIRADIERAGGLGDTSFVPVQTKIIRLPPKNQRDETLVDILCHAKNSPWAEIATPYEVEVEVPDGVEKIRHADGYEDVQVEDGVEDVQVEDGTDGKGKPKFKTEQRPKFKTEQRPKFRIEERPVTRTEIQVRYRMETRPLTYMEKAKIPRWLANLMKGNDHIIIISDLTGD